MEPISRADRVTFLDACCDGISGRDPYRRIVPKKDGAAFTHQSTPESLLAGALALYGRAPEAVMISVCVTDFMLSEQMSTPVRAALETVVAGLIS